MKAAVVVFPGSNRENDAAQALTLGGRQGRDGLACRDGPAAPAPTSSCCPAASPMATICAAAPSPVGRTIMDAVRAHAARGGLVLGICNGFQILCESGLLPGILMRNANLRFICHRQTLRVERTDTAFTRRYRKGQVIDVCVAHGEGNYTADAETLAPPRGRRARRLPLQRRARRDHERRQPQRLDERHRRHLLGQS